MMLHAKYESSSLMVWGKQIFKNLSFEKGLSVDYFKTRLLHFVLEK